MIVATPSFVSVSIIIMQQGIPMMMCGRCSMSELITHCNMNAMTVRMIAPANRAVKAAVKISIVFSI